MQTMTQTEARIEFTETIPTDIKFCAEIFCRAEKLKAFKSKSANPKGVNQVRQSTFRPPLDFPPCRLSAASSLGVP